MLQSFTITRVYLASLSGSKSSTLKIFESVNEMLMVSLNTYKGSEITYNSLTEIPEPTFHI